MYSVKSVLELAENVKKQGVFSQKNPSRFRKLRLNLANDRNVNNFG